MLTREPEPRDNASAAAAVDGTGAAAVISGLRDSGSRHSPVIQDRETAPRFRIPTQRRAVFPRVRVPTSIPTSIPTSDRPRTDLGHGLPFDLRVRAARVLARDSNPEADMRSNLLWRVASLWLRAVLGCLARSATVVRCHSSTRKSRNVWRGRQGKRNAKA